MPKTIIVALGNPGAEYKNTYHNAGWIMLDELSHGDDSLKKYKDLFTFQEVGDFIFIKPLTYMNESGKAVRAALKKFNADPADFILIHDDSDLVIGNYKISSGRSSAGHKGVQSVIDALKTNAFQRIRIGIRPVREAKRQKAADFALKQITTADRKKLASLVGVLKGHLEGVRSSIVLNGRKR